MLTPTRQLVVFTFAATLWSGMPARGGPVLSTPEGLHAGDRFRFVFLTPGSTQPSSSNIATYNAYVTAQAGGATYNGATLAWSVIGSTSAVNAIDNVGQAATPLYLSDGTLVTTDTTSSGLWSGSILHPIDEDLTGRIRNNLAVYTGTSQSGQHSGNPLGSFSITIGNSGMTNSTWVQGVAFPDIIPLSMYGVSEVLTAVPEPSSLMMMGTAFVGMVLFGWSRKRADRRLMGPIRTKKSGPVPG